MSAIPATTPDPSILSTIETDITTSVSQTLRQKLEADIAAVKADLASKESALAELAEKFPGTIEKDITEVKAFFSKIAHLL